MCLGWPPDCVPHRECGDAAPPSGGRWDTMSDPNVHWDGQRWLHWNGEEWVPDPSAPPPMPKKSHTGAIIATIAVALVFVLLLVGGGLWLVM